MAIIDRIGGIFGGSEDEDQELANDQNETKTEKKSQTEDKNEHSKPNVLDFTSAFSNREEISVSPTKVTKSKIVTVSPKDINDAKRISDCLCDRITVIVNFEDTDTVTANRIASFVCGTLYAIGGEFKPVSARVFICAPGNVKISSSEDDEKNNFKIID